MTTSEDSSPSISLNGTQSSTSTKAPKFGMMIPNRIFVGGITGNTTEAELRQFFSTFGAIKDCKIITDRAGVSKGYGFVTFVQLEDAEKLVQKEGEHHLIFKDRKLNIGPAVRKQQAQTVTAVPQYPQLFETSSPGTIVYANGLPYLLQNGLAMYHVPEGYGVQGTSPMVAPSYPLILPQQPNVAQPGYYQTPTAAAAALQMSGCPAPSPSWPFATQNMGLPMVSASHVPMAGGGQMAVGHPSGLDQYIYQMPQMFSAGPAEMAAGHPTGALHYQRVYDGQLPMIDPVGQEGSLITEPSIASGHLQYVDMQRFAASALGGGGANSAAAVAGLAPASKENGNILLTSNVQKTPMQNYGIKRVLSMPQEIVQSSSNPYGIYGFPPVKIFAGQDRQRIVTQAVMGNSEIQIIPKTQS